MVRQAREKQKITQEQLANELGISRLSINNYERGEQSPSLDTAVRIMLYLDISLDELSKQSFLQQALEQLPDRKLSQQLQKIVKTQEIDKTKG